jgi:hypothetical protein
MASTLISPGVLTLENDQPFITQQPIVVGAAIIGPTVKGPVEVPTIITSYSQYQNTFGTNFTSGSQVYTYFTSIAAYNYFANGGETLLVSRVTTGSFTSATSTPISASNSASAAFTLETLSKGVIMNSSSSLNSDGTLPSGSKDNIRWQIANSDTSSGTFTLLVRQGDDTTTNPSILETWTNLSMDPFAPNYVSKVIGDYTLNYNSTNNQIQISGSYPNASKYIRVKDVNFPTPNYFKNDGTFKVEYTSSIPLNASGAFQSAIGNLFNGKAQYYNTITDGNASQGINSSSYDNMINLLSNTDDYQFNVLITPGLFNSLQTSKCTSIISNTENRGDNIYILDLVPYDSTESAVVTQAASRNTSYAASYWPWVQTIDPDTGANVWVPASTMMAGVFAYSDKVSEPWFAPAGINRGGLGNVIRPEQKLSPSSRNTLYNGKVNPIANFPGTGVSAYGNKTLQTKSSALDRVNVRRLLISLKSYISQVANNLVFDQNTTSTRNIFLSQVNPYLESVQQKQGLYAFKVVMDDSNNTAETIDRSQLIGAIYIQPTKTAEFIYLNFNILPTGVEFS